MSNGKAKKTAVVQPAPAALVAKADSPPTRLPPLFRPIDWLTFGVTTLFVWIGYYLTLAPDLGLEDSGELAVGSFYAGIPHPPGYPVWTMYTWLWTVLLPFKNIAWRVALGEATAGALAAGLLGFLVSRGSSMMIEGIADLKNIERRWENVICVVSGFVAGMLLGFNGYMWSQSVIVEVYSFSLLSLMAVLLGLLRWTYAPTQFRYLYVAFFMYGICFNNHQSLLVIALSMEALILVVHPKLAREMFFWNTVTYIGGLVLGAMGYLDLLFSNTPVKVIFNSIGLASAALWVWLAVKTKVRALEIARGCVVVGVLGYLGLVFGVITSYVTTFDDSRGGLVLLHIVGIAAIVALVRLYQMTRTTSREWLVTLGCGVAWIVGAAFYLYMPLAGMTNPPMQWGYPRTVEGFFHAITRGQYERINPTSGVGNDAFEIAASFITTFAKQLSMFLEGLNDEFNWVCLVLAVVMFIFYRRMQARERAWTVGITAFFVVLGPFLVLLFNLQPDRQARELIRVFFTASHIMVAMGVGYGLTLISCLLATHYEKARRLALAGGGVALDLALFLLVVATQPLIGEAHGAESNSMESFLRFVFLLLPGASLMILVVRLFFSSVEAGKDFHATFALGSIVLGSLLCCVQAFAPALSGIEQSSLTGFAKILCWGLAATCLYLRRRPERGGDFMMLPFVGGLAALLSVGLTLATLLANKPGMEGFGAFFKALATAFRPDQYAAPVIASLILLGMITVFLLAIFLRRARAPLGLILVLFAALPVHSVMTHWFDNEQRGHLFGYWFGHDMFTPPFAGPDGKFGDYDAKNRAEMMKDPQKAKLIYPEMARDAVLYGGTDPGRFCPTYMIFDESFIPARCKPLDPNFDRRDVYIITQNALADGTYLNYIRAHYNRSTQKDPPFFQELLRGPKERELGYTTNFLARVAFTLLDRPFLKLGADIEARRRREGVYPPKEMYIASPDDSQRCFQEYLADAQRRVQHDKDFPNEPRQIKPGENVRIIDNRVQVSGQVAVMTINGLITKVMFDHNPTNEFYVEESFPLDWMYPHLTPFGIIMKINRKPLPSLSEEILQRDHEFWSNYSERLIGNWITYDTPVKEIADFAEKVYLRRDLSGFKGDPRFVRDDQGQKAFSKLRSSIGGVYAWRLSSLALTPEGDYRPKTKQEFDQLFREADFAFRQAFAFCPYSPEAVFRYVQLLTQPQVGRYEDALRVAETCLKLDPYNGQVIGLVASLRDTVKRVGEMEKIRSSFEQMEKEYKTHPTNYQAAFNLASAYMSMQQTNRAMTILENMIQLPQVDPQAVLATAKVFADMRDWPRLELTLERLVKLMPNEPETWYDLAALKSGFGKPTEAMTALTQALELSNQRLKRNPNASNLVNTARNDGRFTPLRQLPEFQKLIPP